MNNKDKKDNGKETENITSHPLESTNLTLILENIETMSEGLNTITNSLIPVMEMTDRYSKIINDFALVYQSLHH